MEPFDNVEKGRNATLPTMQCLSIRAKMCQFDETSLKLKLAMLSVGRFVRYGKPGGVMVGS